MRIVFLLLAIFSGAAFAADSHDVYYQGNLTPLNIMPTFEKGYLAVYDIDHQIALYTHDGSLLYRVTAQVDGASFTHISNAAVDENGTLAVAVDFRMPTAAAPSGGILTFDPTGAQIGLINTGGYLPTQVSFGPDHSTWAIGYYRPSKPDDYFVLRNYSSTGELIGGYLPRSSFEPELAPVGPCIGGWQLRVSDRNVVALFYASSIYKPGQQERAMLQWVETDLRGKELLRRDLPRTHFALGRNGSFYGQFDGVAVLDGTTGKWRKVAAGDGTLLGADSDTLVFLPAPGNMLRWVPVGH